MRDLICDGINYCASIFVMGKIILYDQIVINNLRRKGDRYQTYFKWIYI